MKQEPSDAWFVFFTAIATVFAAAIAGITMWAIIELVNRVMSSLQSISYKLDAIERYDDRLQEHIDSDVCTSSLPRTTWDIENEDCLVCKDLMQRIEERESEIPRWVYWLSAVVVIFHPIEAIQAWRRSRAERADARDTPSS